jgi:hypothetical protein
MGVQSRSEWSWSLATNPHASLLRQSRQNLLTHAESLFLRFASVPRELLNQRVARGGATQWNAEAHVQDGVQEAWANTARKVWQGQKMDAPPGFKRLEEPTAIGWATPRRQGPNRAVGCRNTPSLGHLCWRIAGFSLLVWRERVGNHIPGLVATRWCGCSVGACAKSAWSCQCSTSSWGVSPSNRVGGVSK